jgi:aspartyl protease family protein
MFRAWFILIIVVGFLSSAVASCGSRMSSAPGTFAQDSDDHVVDRIRSASYSNGDDEDEDEESGDGLVLRKNWDGHFYADTQINGTTIRMLVDTGASGIALTRDDARRAGIGISIGMPKVVGQGAGGEVKGEYVTLDRISLGGESAESLPAVVLDGGGQSLLGQSFLEKFATVEIKGDRMVLR